MGLLAEVLKPARDWRWSGPRSIFGRLALFAVIWAAALLLAGAVGLTALYRSAVYRDLNAGLDVSVRTLMNSVEAGPNGLFLSEEPGDAAFSRTFSGRYWWVAPGGDAAAGLRSRSLWDETVRLPVEAVGRLTANPGRIISLSASGPEGAPLHVRAAGVRLDLQAPPAVFAVGADRSTVAQDVRRFARATAWTLAVFALAFFGVVIGLVRLGLRPLRDMGADLAAVRGGARARLDPPHATELAPLADELNALLAHNQMVVDRARAQAGDLAHALKTPLAVLVNAAENDASPLAGIAQRQAAAMRDHVDRHLKRAGAAARARDVRSQTLAGPALEELLRTLEKIYADRIITATVSGAGLNTPVRAAREDLTEILGNILDNAYKWARSAIHVTAEARDQMLIITVVDDGPGLTDQQREDALKRGVRMDQSAPGSGLGLAIVSDVVSALNGEVRLEHAELGGLAVVVTLPLATSNQR